MDCRPLGSSIHGILQARILEWIAMPSSRGSSRPRDWTHISYVSCMGRWVLYNYWHWEALIHCQNIVENPSPSSNLSTQGDLDTTGVLKVRGLVLHHQRLWEMQIPCLSPRTSESPTLKMSPKLTHLLGASDANSTVRPTGTHLTSKACLPSLVWMSSRQQKIEAYTWFTFLLHYLSDRLFHNKPPV